MKKIILPLLMWSISSLWGTTVYPCSTPVHRYAMYNWKPSTYLVCYFHDGQKDARDNAFSQELIASFQDIDSLVNITYEAIDISNGESLKEAPTFIKEAWELHKSAVTLPIHMVFSPLGVELFAGLIDKQSQNELVESPIRKKLAELLTAGNNGLFLFLPGKDDAMNKQALKETQRAIELAKKRMSSMQGISDPVTDSAAIHEDTDGKDSDAKDPDVNVQVGFLELSREDPHESWLLRQLMAIEKLSPEEISLPMVFGVYGRGRALEPYMGKGIHADNLMEVISFINGACSCEVKDQNPGVDLLMTQDWNQSAVTMAKRIGQESGNELLLEESAFNALLDEMGVEVVSAPKAPGEEPVETLPETTSPVAYAEEVSVQKSDSRKQFLFVLIPVIGLAALGLAVATFVILRRKRVG